MSKVLSSVSSCLLCHMFLNCALGVLCGSQLGTLLHRMGHLAMPGDLLNCHDVVQGVLRVLLTRDADKRPTTVAYAASMLVVLRWSNCWQW